MEIEKSRTNPFRYDPIGAKFAMLESAQSFWRAFKAYLTGRWPTVS